MATAASILAVVRAAAPAVSSRADQLAFALHAAVLACGYRLVAVGEHAQLAGLAPDAPDVAVTGWNSSSSSGGEGSYTFAYLSEGGGGDSGEQQQPAAAAAAAGPAAAAAAPVLKLLLRVVPVGDAVIASLATDAESAQPQTLELPLDEYVNAAGSGSNSGGGGGGSSSGGTGGEAPLPAAKAYRHLDRLAAAVNGALAELTAASTGDAAGGGAAGGGSQKKQCTGAGTSGSSGGGASAAAAAAAAAAAREAEQREQEREGFGGRRPEPRRPQEPDYDPLRIGPPRRPVRIGEDDVMPYLGGGGMLPGAPPLMGGGGMHVGPGNPLFADRMRHPDVMPGRGGAGGPGGIRWDPISPEGLQGWRPEDFQRPRPGQPGPGSGFRPDIDPDLAQPGPGRGTDFDHMFG